MPSFVVPRTFLVGATVIDKKGLRDYLEATDNLDFLASLDAAVAAGLSDAEIITSFMAKLCYASLTLGQNLNVTRTRDIKDNFVACLDQGHGSVLEHFQVNFVTTDCSRVLTHELVRHRVGTAFSQTSGRYVRSDRIKFVHDPILDHVRDEIMDGLRDSEERYVRMCNAAGVNGREAFYRSHFNMSDGGCAAMWEELAGRLGFAPDKDMPFDVKKKLTSALRRVMPNGQANEIGWSLNLRSLRHTVQMRTSRHAEWEIRLVFNQVYDLIDEKFPLVFKDCTVSSIGGLREISGMKMQTYEKSAGQVLKDLPTEVIEAEIALRKERGF